MTKEVMIKVTFLKSSITPMGKQFSHVVENACEKQICHMSVKEK